MNAEWMTSPVGPRVQALENDPRPAWLWSGDGERAIWSNAAARVFGDGLTRNNARGATLIPIKGQVARLLRLGATGRASLARVQFSLGKRPVSATCTCTPLRLPDLQQGLLMVGLEPVDPALLAVHGAQASPGAAETPDESPAEVPKAMMAEGEADPAGADESAGDGRVIMPDPGSATAPESQHQAETEIAGETRPDAGPQFDRGAGTSNPELLGRSGEPIAAEPQELPSVAAAEVARSGPTARGTSPDKVGTGYSELAEVSPPDPDHKGEDSDPAVRQRLSALFDRLAGDERLFTPLGAEDEPPLPTDDGGMPGAAPPGSEDSVLPLPTEVESAPDPETVERASRYNFDELSRILTDRVGGGEPPGGLTIEAIVRDAEVEIGGAAAENGDGRGELRTLPPSTAGSLVNLSGETLVLNRLPLGILVFRDQQVLFANRAITEMVGYDSVEELRRAGLAAIFPASGGAEGRGGPVNHLVQRDGTLVPVTARLQSTSWQGKPALMLSASATEVRTGHEGAVRAFAEMLAETRADGFIETNRAGVIASASPRAAELLRRGAQSLAGRPLAQLVHPDDMMALRAFLERPARFAETARPCLGVKTVLPGVDMLLFAQGQAGVVSGYFGFVRGLESVPVLPGAGPIDAGLLGRISRGVRRPLNTIIGFSDLIRSGAFGPLANARYKEYADDIKQAGHEIAALVDELDDYTRLKDGRYLPNMIEIDLAGLLESCVVRVRGQANAARVIVRSAISERLPRITADRPSLGQAALNLLASAIDQTPPGGSVVISAQQEEDGGISVHIRDSARTVQDPSDRFVVFRDGPGRDGEAPGPVRSSVGLALTRSLLDVNGAGLSVDPAGATGTVFAITIPAELVSAALLAPAGRAD